MTVFVGRVTIQVNEPAPGRIVRAIRRSTGALLAETNTDGDGNYTIDSGAVDSSDVVLVALPTEFPGASPSYNAEILDQIV